MLTACGVPLLHCAKVNARSEFVYCCITKIYGAHSAAGWTISGGKVS